MDRNRGASERVGVGMSHRRARRHRSAILRTRLAQLPAVLITCALVLGFGWWTAVGWDSGMERCLAQYARAQTTADSARVDLVPRNGRSRTSCGDLRRNGTLDRHRRSVEGGRAVPPRGR
ncbi:MAG TPA: hypothetical protein VEQ60_27870 [Longimicrobium sp.]|nr:hypothetical protein [Longimicrobium sp.]